MTRSPLDWARDIARTYRTKLQIADPDTCARLDQQARATGQHWLLPIEIPEAADGDEGLDAELTAADIENILRIPANTIRQWAKRGLLPQHTAPDGSPRYRVAEVLACQSRRYIREST